MSDDAEYKVTHPAVVRHLGLKVTLLVIASAVIFAGFIAYVAWARGAFRPVQVLTLRADSAEGISVGMDLSFRGFPVGRVRGISLGEDAKARVVVAIPVADAKWLRSNSVYTMERSVVGTAKLRAFTSDLGAAPLEDGAVRDLIRGDATEEIPQILANVRRIIENVDAMTGHASALNQSLASLSTVTGRMAGKAGVLEAALGSQENAQKVIASIERTNALLAELQAVTRRVDGVVARADQRVLGAGGVMDQAQKGGAQLNALLVDARESLKKADAILANLQSASANANAASADLPRLRAEVDATMRKLGALVDELNRKWPFERDVELRLP